MWWLALGEHDVPTSTDWLSSDEIEHVGAIRFTKRRDEYLTRRWTTKCAVAGVLGLDVTPDEFSRIEVRHRESGAPYVHLDGAPAELDVSMSDRSGWAVCLVGTPGSTASGTVGIDLEVVEARSARFVADYFTPAERALVAASPSRHDELANLIWSAKEAALKVRQVGLRVDTRTVDVDLHGERIVDGWTSMTVNSADGAMPGWWRRFGEFLLTIAFDRPTEPPRLLPGSRDIEQASPRHSWVDSPTC